MTSVWKQSYNVFTRVSVSGSLAIISARMCSTPVATSSTEDRPDTKAQRCKNVFTLRGTFNSHNLVYALPSTPGFTHCFKSSVCGVSISAEAATSRPSALALRAFVSLLPFLYGEYCNQNRNKIKNKTETPLAKNFIIFKWQILFKIILTTWSSSSNDLQLLRLCSSSVVKTPSFFRVWITDWVFLARELKNTGTCATFYRGEVEHQNKRSSNVVF